MDRLSEDKRVGKVYLVGSGPGDPELLTVKAKRLIESADVIIYDHLPGPEILAMMPGGSEKIDAGKRAGDHRIPQHQINELLIRKAREGKSVVRLKGGDPYLFGRGGEEAAELRRAGIPVEVVPGITSAIAAPAYAGIPVTHRDHASMLTIITGHEDPTKRETALDWKLLAEFEGTLIILMGVKMLKENTRELLKHGKDPKTPVAIIERGTRPDQRTTRGTLDEIARIAEEEGVRAPAVIVIGSVAALGE